MKTVYLASPMSGMTLKATNRWREIATEFFEDLGVKCLSPLRDKEYPDILDKNYIGDSLFFTSKFLTLRDRNDVKSSDLILFNFSIAPKKISIGSLIEVGWADAFDKPSVCIIQKENNVHLHPMLIESCDFVVDSLESGLYVAASVLGV